MTNKADFIARVARANGLAEIERHRELALTGPEPEHPDAPDPDVEYDRGFNDGYDKGYDAGHAAGMEEGYNLVEMPGDLALMLADAIDMYDGAMSVGSRLAYADLRSEIVDAVLAKWGRP